MADCTGKTARDKTGRNMRDPETDDGELPSLGGEAGGEGRLRDIPTGLGSESGDGGQRTCNAHPLGGTLSVIRLGVYTH